MLFHLISLYDGDIVSIETSEMLKIQKWIRLVGSILSDEIALSGLLLNRSDLLCD